MKNNLLFLLVCGVLQVHGQYVADTTHVFAPKKNQIGAVVNPLAAVMLGTSTSQLHYGLQYKRLLQDHRRLRFSVLYQTAQPNVQDLGEPISSTDSTVTFIDEQLGYQYGEFRAGIEWSDFRTKHDAIYGVDLIAGYDVTRKENHQKLVSYTVLPEIVGPATTVEQDTMVSFHEQRSLVFGAALILGYRVTMKERWELMVHASPEIVYFAPVSESGRREPGEEGVGNSVQFRLRLLDISLAYSF